MTLQAERETRVQLAGLYRVFASFGWDELIYNHISARVPGTDHFLINEYGLHYSEITASNLVKIDLDGGVVGERDAPVNPAGFVIHSAIHAARDDAHWIAHTHTTAGSAVACLADGLRNDNFYSCVIAHRVAYHDFEGITVRPDEKPRLVENLGERDFLILRNHGLLTCGEDAASCFANHWILQRSCEIQVATDSAGGEVIPITADARGASAAAVDAMMQFQGYGALELAAMLRRVERLDPGYKE